MYWKPGAYGCTIPARTSWRIRKCERPIWGGDPPGQKKSRSRFTPLRLFLANQETLFNASDRALVTFNCYVDGSEEAIAFLLDGVARSNDNVSTGFGDGVVSCSSFYLFSQGNAADWQEGTTATVGTV